MSGSLWGTQKVAVQALQFELDTELTIRPDKRNGKLCRPDTDQRAMIKGTAVGRRQGLQIINIISQAPTSYRGLGKGTEVHTTWPFLGFGKL